MKTLFLLLALQTQEVPLPKVDYSKYGSISNQMKVYNYMRSEKDRADLEKYKRFREEVKKQTPPQITTIMTFRNESDRLRLEFKGKRNYPFGGDMLVRRSKVTVYIGK